MMAASLTRTLARSSLRAMNLTVFPSIRLLTSSFFRITIILTSSADDVGCGLSLSVVLPSPNLSLLPSTLRKQGALHEPSALRTTAKPLPIPAEEEALPSLPRGVRRRKINPIDCSTSEHSTRLLRKSSAAISFPPAGVPPPSGFETPSVLSTHDGITEEPLPQLYLVVRLSSILAKYSDTATFLVDVSTLGRGRNASSGRSSSVSASSDTSVRFSGTFFSNSYSRHFMESDWRKSVLHSNSLVMRMFMEGAIPFPPFLGEPPPPLFFHRRNTMPIGRSLVVLLRKMSNNSL
mmetsp:Transcript_2214/g.4821  ORF Transcript_2214/g.4821 Transcript_2214/m.4821 type:complete len:292 (-) Transcript_2214:2160-3035(-)